MNLKLNQKGDTIVEVLISVAVVSLILTASYALSNRSSLAIRQAQERSEALKFSESQLENLRAYLATGGNWTAGDLCMLDNSAKTNVPAQCNKGTDGRYRMSVAKNGDIYTVSATWTRVGGTGDDNVKISYSIPN